MGIISQKKRRIKNGVNYNDNDDNFNRYIMILNFFIESFSPL